ncbi:cellulose biosynthesis cyclic di-GMP-binding regulatory protein BcsB [Phyllobacterium sp. SYP-B3895]|uniref:cellulose biosynthesis cyclic di-GMP-binding regulatory protein BcsB n=1 Tax=Phyllobacterium sp. SYP-B3895 TaxID=2663240 RepID=UPI001562685C|nr:cellulose biosynthesis cyclic di-GMP-binding regulatory protein BcsB [Phyllobacterium sp. SYP-B3895]
MKRLLNACLFLGLSTLSSYAQVAPFDMSPERPAEPAPVEKPAAPFSPLPGQQAPAAPAPAPKLPPAPIRADGQWRRYIVPQDSLSFSGENGDKTWAVFITADQAAAPATLTMAYQSSLVVAPEWSTMTVSINNARIISEPVQSPEGRKTLTAKIPAGVLKEGLNTFRINTSLRHRTDCTVQSTYELWTEVDPSKTYLSFTGDNPRRLKKLDDIRAIGVDGTGRTAFNIVVPAIDRTQATAPMLHTAQGLAILANMPNQTVTVSSTLPAEQSPGALTVLLGTDEELQTLALWAGDSRTAPGVAFVDDPATGSSILRFRGADWQSVTNAVAGFVDPLKRDLSVPRTFISTQTWRSPDVPLFISASRVKLSELGVDTKNFTGRRLRTEFAIGVPSDFYANEYGKATILLDAAYSEDVLPGSQINIYVNDNIAATLPITTSGGEILRHFPISFTMRHFRPGVNLITIEAALTTKTDSICAPGSNASSTTRFALFDSSEFVIPSFARIGTLPNLAGLSGTSFPYNRSSKPLPVVMNNAGEKSLSAAATLLARMAVAAGRPMEVDPRATANSAMNSNALFIGAIPQIESSVLTQTGISENTRTIWSAVKGNVEPAPEENTQSDFNEWRERLSGRGWRGQISSFDDWLNRTFNISLASLMTSDESDAPYTPEPAATLLVAQRPNPNGDGVWTVATSATDDNLIEGVRALTRQDHWPELQGHISIYKAGTDEMQMVPVGNYTFVQSQPLSFSNMRLVIANWLSGNILWFSLILVVLACLLGITTSRMLANLGRRI